MRCIEHVILLSVLWNAAFATTKLFFPTFDHAENHPRSSHHFVIQKYPIPTVLFGHYEEDRRRRPHTRHGEYVKEPYVSLDAWLEHQKKDAEVHPFVPYDKLVGQKYEDSEKIFVHYDEKKLEESPKPSPSSPHDDWMGHHKHEEPSKGSYLTPTKGYILPDEWVEQQKHKESSKGSHVHHYDSGKEQNYEESSKGTYISHDQRMEQQKHKDSLKPSYSPHDEEENRQKTPGKGYISHDDWIEQQKQKHVHHYDSGEEQNYEESSKGTYIFHEQQKHNDSPKSSYSSHDEEEDRHKTSTKGYITHDEWIEQQKHKESQKGSHVHHYDSEEQQKHGWMEQHKHRDFLKPSYNPHDQEDDRHKSSTKGYITYAEWLEQQTLKESQRESHVHHYDSEEQQTHNESSKDEWTEHQKHKESPKGTHVHYDLEEHMYKEPAKGIYIPHDSLVEEQKYEETVKGPSVQDHWLDTKTHTVSTSKPEDISTTISVIIPQIKDTSNIPEKLIESLNRAIDKLNVLLSTKSDPSSQISSEDKPELLHEYVTNAVKKLNSFTSTTKNESSVAPTYASVVPTTEIVPDQSSRLAEESNLSVDDAIKQINSLLSAVPDALKLMPNVKTETFNINIGQDDAPVDIRVKGQLPVTNPPVLPVVMELNPPNMPALVTRGNTDDLLNSFTTDIQPAPLSDSVTPPGSVGRPGVALPENQAVPLELESSSVSNSEGSPLDGSSSPEGNVSNPGESTSEGNLVLMHLSALPLSSETRIEGPSSNSLNASPFTSTPVENINLGEASSQGGSTIRGVLFTSSPILDAEVPKVIALSQSLPQDGDVVTSIPSRLTEIGQSSDENNVPSTVVPVIADIEENDNCTDIQPEPIQIDVRFNPEEASSTLVQVRIVGAESSSENSSVELHFKPTELTSLAPDAIFFPGPTASRPLQVPDLANRVQETTSDTVSSADDKEAPTPTTAAPTIPIDLHYKPTRPSFAPNPVNYPEPITINPVQNSESSGTSSPGNVETASSTVPADKNTGVDLHYKPTRPPFVPDPLVYPQPVTNQPDQSSEVTDRFQTSSQNEVGTVKPPPVNENTSVDLHYKPTRPPFAPNPVIYPVPATNKPSQNPDQFPGTPSLADEDTSSEVTTVKPATISNENSPLDLHYKPTRPTFVPDPVIYPQPVTNNFQSSQVTDRFQPTQSSETSSQMNTVKTTLINKNTPIDLHYKPTRPPHAPNPIIYPQPITNRPTQSSQVTDRFQPTPSTTTTSSKPTPFRPFPTFRPRPTTTTTTTVRPPTYVVTPIVLGYKPSRPPYAPNPVVYPQPIIRPGTPWPASSTERL